MSRANLDPVDWASCLMPLGEAPCGPALSHDPVYAAIREARREDDDLPQGVWERERKRADWAQALSLSLGALRERTKELQLAGWACEAALMEHGFVSLAGGLRMVAGLCSAFGDCLHPQVDGGDQEARLARFAWLDATLAERVSSLPLTEPEPGTSEACSYADWLRMEHHERLQSNNGNGKKNGNGVRDGRSILDHAGMQTSPAFHAALHADVREVLAALEALSLAADSLCGAQAPSFHALRERLKRIDERVLAWHPVPPEDVREPASSSPEPSPKLFPRPASRAEAYAMLSCAAEYLMRTEPHSPTPWLVKRAVVWGDMPLATLLDELLGQGENLASIKRLLGMTKE